VHNEPRLVEPAPINESGLGDWNLLPAIAPSAFSCPGKTDPNRIVLGNARLILHRLDVGGHGVSQHRALRGKTMYYQVTCITKSTPHGNHEHITSAGGKGWNLPVTQCIAIIHEGVDGFYVQDDAGRRAFVGVVRPVGRPAYIRTYADGVWTDNLLSLSACLI
jgi:hypothetical protein